MLNLLGMIDSPSKGEYYFMDEEVGNLPERKRSNVRKHNLGFVFQSFNLIDELTVFENVELPMLYTKVPGSRAQKTSRGIARTHEYDAPSKPLPPTALWWAAAKGRSGTGHREQPKTHPCG